MNSELRRELMPTIEAGSHKGRQMMNDFAGIDLEKQVHHVVAYRRAVHASRSAGAGSGQRFRAPWCLSRAPSTRRASSSSSASVAAPWRTTTARRCSCTARTEGMSPLGSGGSGSDRDRPGRSRPARARSSARRLRQRAGHHDQRRDDESHSRQRRQHRMGGRAVRRRQPPHAAAGAKSAGQVPPLRLVSVKANVNGGMKATIRAETGDEAAADQLRDVVRGFVSLARLQGGGSLLRERAEIDRAFRAPNKTVQMSFAMAPDTLRMLAPRRRGGRTLSRESRSKV